MDHEPSFRSSRYSRFRLFLLIGSALFFLIIALIWLPTKWIESEQGRRWLLDNLHKQGISANYGRLELAPFGGELTIYDVAIPMPAPHRPVSPSLATLSQIKIDWSSASLLTGDIQIHAIELTGVAMHIARDEMNRTSFDLLLGDPPTTAETVARSQLLERLKSPVSLTIHTLALHDFSLDYVELVHDKIDRRVALSEIALRAKANLTSDRPASASLSLIPSTNTDGSRIKFADGDTTQEYVFKHETRLTLDPAQIIAVVSQFDLVHHDMPLALLTPSRLMDLDMKLSFDAKAAAVHLHIDNLGLFNDALRGTFALIMPDDADDPILEHGAGELALKPLLALLPPELADLSVDQGHFTFQLTPPESGDDALALITGTGAAAQMTLSSPQGILTLDDSQLTVNGRLWRDRYQPTLTLPTDELGLSDNDDPVPGGYFHVEVGVKQTTIQSPTLMTKLEGLQNKTSLEFRGPVITGGLLNVAFESLHTEILPNGDTLTAKNSKLGFELKDADRAVVWPQALQGHGSSTGIVIRRASGESLRVGMLDFAGSTIVHDHGTASMQIAVPLNNVALRAPATDSTAQLQQITLSVIANQATDGQITRVSGKLPFSGLTLNAGQRAMVFDHGRIEWLLSQLAIDFETPLDSSGHFNFSLAADNMTASSSGNLANRQLSAEYKFDAEVKPTFSEYLPTPSDAGIEALGLALTGATTWSDLAHPSSTIKHDARLKLAVHTTQPNSIVTQLPLIDAKLKHQSRAAVHTTHLQATLHPLRTDTPLPEQSATLLFSAQMNPNQRTSRMTASLDSADGLEAKFEGNAVLSRDGTLRHTARLDAKQLKRIKTFIPSGMHSLHTLDLSNLTLHVKSHGEVSRLLNAAGELQQNWRDHLAGTQFLEAEFRNVLHENAGLVVALPHIDLTSDAQIINGAMTAKLALEIPRLELEAAGQRISLRDSGQTLHLESDSLRHDASMNISLDGRISSIDQTFYPAYPIGDATVSGHLALNQLSELSLDDFVFVNKRGGSRIELHKHFERDRRNTASSSAKQRTGSTRIALRGNFEQDLEHIDAQPEHFHASGKITAPFSLESGDGSLFRLRAELALDDVSFSMPNEEVNATGIQGRIRLEEALEWSPPLPPRIVPHTERNPFTRTRFEDIQPFFAEGDRLTIKHLQWRAFDAGPITSIAYIDRNIIALQNLRLEKTPGIVTGTLVIDYLPGAESIHFRGNATGLRSGSTRSPLDANTAFVLTPATLEIDGRVHIIRISRNHLHELLDLFDPFHEDISLNNLRKKLVWSYPRSVRIAMAQGLMSLQVELGGLGALFQVGEIRGIPLGPFMNRHVAPLLYEEEKHHD